MSASDGFGSMYDLAAKKLKIIGYEPFKAFNLLLLTFESVNCFLNSLHKKCQEWSCPYKKFASI